MVYLVSFLAVFLSLSTFAFEMKIITPDGYSKPWLVLFENQEALSKASFGRVHFHGFTQDQKTGNPFMPQYDFPWADENKTPTAEQFLHFVNSYEMERELKHFPNHILLIPIARGHCDQYPELYDIKKFDSVLNSVLQKAGIKEINFSLIMASAHSGGGEVLSRLLERSSSSKYFTTVVRVDLYDAIYSNLAEKRVSKWVLGTTPHHSLRLFSIPMQEPARHGELIFASAPGKEVTGSKVIREIKVKDRTKIFLPDGRVSIIQNKTKQLTHWSLVKSLWLY